LTIFLEGEEESGSPSLVPFLEANREELSCDLALICDTGLFEEATPAITTMLRGLAKAEFTIRAASRDLHSGMYGGLAQNPLHVMARLLADLHDATGRVQVPGFYDDVDELPDTCASNGRRWPSTTPPILAMSACRSRPGEQDRTPLEKIWSRPTAEVNGMWGGYNGAGFKTVLPSEAHAKVSFRLVSRQDPEKIIKAFKTWAEARMPADCEHRMA
jgi:acetylornithine deacetylase/succinyl-diaminopimelate desuccinylase-like protein